MKIGRLNISFGKSKTSNIESRQQKALQQFQQILAAYDVAGTNNTNAQHWALADGLSADETNSPAVREIVRNRARYEFDNSSYLKGITKTERNFIVGTGPRIQMKIPVEVSDLYLTNGERIKINITRDQLVRLSKDIRAKWMAWSREVKLSKKLRLLVQTSIKDGEVFGIFFSRKRFKTISLDIKIIEAQFCTASFSAVADPQNIDGIKLDSDGYPESYSFLKDTLTQEFITVKAENVIHLFSEERPGQHRGVSQTAPGLPLFAQMRDYTTSVVASARLAAAMSMFLETNINEYAQNEDQKTVGKVDDDVDAWEYMPVKNAGINILPTGSKLNMVKAEQPVNTYGDFKGEIINEYGRGRNMPYNVSAGNSKDYNYASGRLDYQFFDRNITIEKDDLELDILNEIYAAFYAELSLLPQFAILRKLGGVLPYTWIWDGVPHVDPVKAATAQEKKLKNGTTTEAREAAKDGLDWEDVQEQRAVELANKKRVLGKHGLTVDEAAALNSLDAKNSAGTDTSKKENNADEE